MIKFSFVQNSENRIDMTVDEVNQAITKATGEATDVIDQAGEALSIFWANFSSGIGKYASDAYSDISKALVDVGDYLSNASNDIGNAIADTANVAGGFIVEATDSAGEAIGGAVESVGDSIGDAVEGIGNFWNGLWGN